MNDGVSPANRERWLRLAGYGRARRGAFACAALVVALASGGDACAEICKYIDADGNTHYTNLSPERGWRRLSCTSGDDPTLRRPGNAVARATPSPPGFPRVDPDTQKGRDDVRRKVLGDELTSEEKALAETRAQYADGAPAPLPEERADAEKYRTRIARLRQSVTLHERNIEALRKELAAIR